MNETKDRIEWMDEDALMIEVLEGPHKGIWRHARYGDWREYIGSPWAGGDYASESLQTILNTFANLK